MADARPIVRIPAPVLRTPTTPVRDPTAPEIRTLIEEMKASCLAANGVGLAAPQIGSSHRLCIINYPRGSPYGLINPEITWQSTGTSVLEEGCLSIPEERVPVARPQKVRVRTLDETGTPREIAADDYLAKVLQHEIDHLNGILITDRAGTAGHRETGGTPTTSP